MRVLAYDPFLTEARAKALGIQLETDLDNLYRDADFITVHMPVTDQTRGMLNAAAFSKMKPESLPGQLCPGRDRGGKGFIGRAGFR